jgi:hypothetical protein
VSTVFTQNFDGVTAPAFPAGWSSPSGLWVTTTAARDTSPNSAFTADPAIVTDRQLFSPSIAISSANEQLAFRHNFNTENTYDGGVLEIAIAGGAFTDIVDAGGAFVTGGYNGTIDLNFGNPLAGRNAWTGNSGGFQNTTVSLPPSAAGQNVQLSWRFGSDSSNAGVGWYVDTITVGRYVCCSGSAAPANLSAVSTTGQGGVQFTVTGTAGYPYAIEASTNLVNWLRLQTNASPFTFIDSNAPAFHNRFYRAVFQP